MSHFFMHCFCNWKNQNAPKGFLVRNGGERKCHLVPWEDICWSCRKRGLGIRAFKADKKKKKTLGNCLRDQGDGSDGPQKVSCSKYKGERNGWWVQEGSSQILINGEASWSGENLLVSPVASKFKLAIQKESYPRLISDTRSEPCN